MAVAGIILPILPTTPMLLVAVWAFSKSSPELAEKIRSHRVFGPPVRDWQDHGVISLKAKSLAIAVMALMGGWLWVFSAICRSWLTLRRERSHGWCRHFCGKPAQLQQA